MFLLTSYSELGDPLGNAEVERIVFSYEKRSAFFLLARLNVLISFYRYSDKEYQLVQNWLLTHTADGDLLKRLGRKFPDERSLAGRLIFHRQQFLLMMKMLVLDEQHEGGRDVSIDVSAQKELAKACLIINDLLLTPEQLKALERRAGKKEEEDRRIRNELFSQLLFTTELSNTPDVGYAAARNQEYVKIFDRERARFPFAGQLGLSERFAQIRRLDLTRYLWLLLGVNASYMHESDNPERVIQEPGRVNIGKADFFAKMDASNEEIEAFFDLMVTDYDHLCELVRMSQPRDQQAMQKDYTVFRTFPLVYTRGQKDVATCIDSGFLQEKIALGLYHTILKSLEGQPDREEFLRRYWGDVFEIYVNERLAEVFPARSNEFFASPKIDRPNIDEQVFDGVLFRGSNLIAFEYKGKYLTLESKYGGDRERLIAELEEKFGLGVRQLARGIGRVFNANPDVREGFSERDKDNNPTNQFGPKSHNNVRRVYPVLMIQDFSLAVGFANFHLRELFEQEMAKYQIESVNIRPLSVMTIEDLEITLPYLKQIKFAEVLERYIQRIEPAKTFQGVFLRFVRKRKLRKPEVDKAMDRITEII